MITVKNTVLRKQTNFWNGCVFHPTDAVEDPWGKRILDRMARDKAMGLIRIYTMFEDIVYMDEFGKLQYDFRLNDLRLDYLVEKGFDIMLAYAAVPDCISVPGAKTSNAKNKSRYKGKMFNTMPPRDYDLWEEVCYVYTKHIVERYGINTVSQWYLHCFNEPDIPPFFLADVPQSDLRQRLDAYCLMYAHFAKALSRVSEKLRFGGPALAHQLDFLEGFLGYVKENDLRLDYIALHHYGTSPKGLNSGEKPLCTENNLKRHAAQMQIIRNAGFGNTQVVVDEWGAASAGFYNREECPHLMFREHEVYSAYFAKLIHGCLRLDHVPSRLMICLSGQHEMTEDFSGFRNFFTMNFIAKPIYNAFLLANKLGEELLAVESGNEHVYTIPTKTKTGYGVMVSYSDDTFTEELPTVEETLVLPEAAERITVWCIDKENTNPYRLYQKMGVQTPNEEQLEQLREEGRLKPVATTSGKAVNLILTPNCTYLIAADISRKGESL